MKIHPLHHGAYFHPSQPFSFEMCEIPKVLNCIRLAIAITNQIYGILVTDFQMHCKIFVKFLCKCWDVSHTVHVIHVVSKYCIGGIKSPITTNSLVPLLFREGCDTTMVAKCCTKQG